VEGYYVVIYTFLLNHLSSIEQKLKGHFYLWNKTINNIYIAHENEWQMQGTVIG